MQIDLKGVFAGFVMAPAFGVAICVLGMMVHFLMTDPAGADLPLGELTPLAASIWFSALMFAYPAAAAFVALWLILRLAGLGALTIWLGGAAAGFAAMGAYLYRLHGGPVSSALAGGRDLAGLTLGEVPGVFALPLIAAGSGVLTALTFALFARR